MGKPTDDVTAAIKEAVDIVQLVSEYIRVEPFGSKYRALCPFHDDRKPSLQIDPQYQNYRCWACGAKGDVFTFVQEYEKISFGEAKSRLAERAGISLGSGHSDSVDSKAPLYRVLAWAQKEFENSLFDTRLGLEARQYLAERHLREETARKYGLGFAPAHFDWLVQRAKGAGFDDQTLLRAGLVKTRENGSVYDAFRARLMVPIRDSLGRVIAFGGRLIPALDDGHGPKYLNSTGTDVYNKSRVLYGLDVAAESLRVRKSSGNKSERPHLIVMEGYLDCLMAYQAGVTHCVATCGTALTNEHIRRLRGYVERVVLMFDGDDAGKKAAKSSIELFLESEVDLRLCLLPDGLDPCDYVDKYGAEKLEALVESAPDAVDFAIKEARERFETSGVAGRSKAMDDVLTTWAALPENARGEQQARFDLAINRLAEVFRMEERSIRGRLKELRESRRKESNTIRVDEAEAPVPIGPIHPREREIAGLLVLMPSRAGDLASLAPPANFRHPQVRTIVESCYRLFEEIGEDATTDSVRERLDDPGLDSLILELVESAPKGEAYDRALQDVCRLLEEDRHRQEVVSMARLAATASQDDHLAVLRELQKRNAP